MFNMKNKKILEKQAKITIIFDYSLFLINLIVIIIGLLSPYDMLHLPGFAQFDTIIWTISIITSSILLALVSYIIGDKTAHAKDKTQHHYNGVLFGIAAFLLSMSFSNIQNTIVSTSQPSSANTPILLGEIIDSWPIAATIAIMVFIAIVYNRNRKNNSMLEFLPYKIVLFGSMIGTLILPIITQCTSGQSSDYIVSNLVFVSIIIIIGISYISIFNTISSISTRVAQSIIAFAIGAIAMTVSGQLAFQLGFDLIVPTAIVLFSGIVTWGIYLALMSRKS